MGSIPTKSGHDLSGTMTGGPSSKNVDSLFSLKITHKEFSPEVRTV